MESEAGDIFSLAWCSGSQTISIGCQNTSIQFFECAQLQSGEVLDPGRSEDSAPSTPQLGSLPKKSKVHKFFNSYPQFERRAADELAVNISRLSQISLVDGSGCVSNANTSALPIALDIPADNVIDSAHYGYVYCMVLIPSFRDGSNDTEVNRFSGHFVTGSGDETLKVCAALLRIMLSHHTLSALAERLDFGSGSHV